jgi:hypothetical protein
VKILFFTKLKNVRLIFILLERYYFGFIDKTTSDEWLNNTAAGTFLVRVEGEEFVLSVQCPIGSVCDFPILRSEDGVRLYPVAKEKYFLNIPDLIHYYRRRSIYSSTPTCDFSVVLLTHPKRH